MLKSKINFATAKTAIDFEWKVVFPCFPHYWSWNTKWSSACLSFANWASACEHQIGSQLCHFPDFQFGGTSWGHLWVKSISCWSLQVVSLHREFMSVWYIRKTLKHGQFWKSNTWHLLILLWDDSLPGWANGSSVGQTEPAPYQEAFRDPGASYHDYCHEHVFPVASFEAFHVEV